MLILNNKQKEVVEIVSKINGIVFKIIFTRNDRMYLNFTLVGSNIDSGYRKYNLDDILNLEYPEELIKMYKNFKLIPNDYIDFLCSDPENFHKIDNCIKVLPKIGQPLLGCFEILSKDGTPYGTYFKIFDEYKVRFDYDEELIPKGLFYSKEYLNSIFPGANFKDTPIPFSEYFMGKALIISGDSKIHQYINSHTQNWLVHVFVDDNGNIINKSKDFKQLVEEYQ